jgi:hypothetical protein
MPEECTAAISAPNDVSPKPDPSPPSPEEILDRAAQVRADWSAYEWEIRQTGDRRVEWSVPRVGVSVVQER